MSPACCAVPGTGIGKNPHPTLITCQPDQGSPGWRRRTRCCGGYRPATGRRWRATTKLAAKQSEDSGSGYFDYSKLQAGEQILFRTEIWEISAEAKLAHYAYPVQTVSVADLAKRRSTEWGLNLRCERRVSRFLKIFAEYDHAQTISNLALEQYVVNTVRGGLNWTF